MTAENGGADGIRLKKRDVFVLGNGGLVRCCGNEGGIVGACEDLFVFCIVLCKIMIIFADESGWGTVPLLDC